MTRFKDEAMTYFSFLLLFLIFVTVQGADEDEVCVKDGAQFRGKRHFSISGKECVPWKDITPALSAGLFPESTVADAENFCRNPEAKSKPYCYVDATTKEFELCNIEKCRDKKGYEMTPQTCLNGHVQSLMGFENGDTKTIYSEGYPNTAKGMPFMGCMVRLEGCKECRFNVKIEAKLPICQSISAGSSLTTCPANCQTVAILDESYNVTLGKVLARAPGTAETVTGEYKSTSNVLQVRYCQMNPVAAEQLAGFMITIYTTTKEVHYHSDSGVIQSPNFPYGYFSRSEIYMYSVQAPMVDTNMTLLFYDWDLNASANSKVTVRWGSSNLADSVEYIASSVRILRPALLIPSNHFTFTFETGSVTNWKKDQEVGFLAEFATYEGPVWEEKPDTNCGSYLSVSESWGGDLIYDKKHDKNLNATFYIDCIWVIEVPASYSKVQYTVENYEKDSEATLSLNYHDGITSQDPLIQMSSEKGETKNKGLFVHLNGSYTSMISLKISYITIAEPSQSVKCANVPNSFFCPEYNFCLNVQLFQVWAVDKCKIDKPEITVAPKVCNAYGEFACKDRSRCYTSLQQCNGVKECDDGSDEVDCFPADSEEPNTNSNVAAIVAPIVVVFILIPIVIVAVYLCKKKADEKKDEELMMNRQELIQRNGGPQMQGFDNLAMDMDEVPISMIAREEQALSRASLQMVGAVGGNVAVHEPPRQPPRETQSYREMSPYEKTAPPARGTQSYRFPGDIDAIEELPQESPKKGRRSDMPQESHPPYPTGPPRSDQQRQFRKRGEKPMTLADYRPGADPKRRQPPPDEDRTPEGRSFRGDQPQKYPPPLQLDDGPRSPGDGDSGRHSPTRERGEKMHPRRRGDQLPGRETQSYRHPPTDYDYEPKQTDRPTRSYRFEPDQSEIVLKPNPRHADVRPKSRPRDIGGVHKKTLGQYKPKGPDPRDPKPPRDTQALDDPKPYKPRKYDQLPDRQTQSYRYPQSNDDDMNSANELRSKSYRFSGSQSELPRTPTSPKSPPVAFEVSGTTSI